MLDGSLLPPDAIAVIGMAGRFPGAANLDLFWVNLVAGRHSVSTLTDERLRAAGVDEREAAHPHYVKLAPLLDGVDEFDAELFGFTEREAQVRDPQQRLFLQTAHEALDNAGFSPSSSRLRVGVYAGGAFNRYAELNVRRNAAAVRGYGEVGVQTANHNDYIATLVAYKLGLTGPAMSVATACSTSLVAIHLASQAIKNGECDVAIAGGVEVEMPYGAGHRWVVGGIFSPDGLCRSYDADAAGTVFGSGVGAVVLKLATDAVRDGDNVLALLRGSAVGNDGSRKAGFTAPGVEGQTAVVSEALAVTELDAGTIGYVEGHGTGTALGDPIEVQALTTAFRRHTDRRGYCVLGSVKSNVGHLGPAAGVAGFIKAVLAVRTGQVPATVHFRRPNPRMDLETTPFVVSGQTAPWPISGGPRRAGVSSFGIGGTNAHVLLEQAPERASAPPVTGPVLLTLSAASSAALAGVADRLAGHLSTSTDGLAEVAHTLAVGRRASPYRATVVAADHDEAAARLTVLADAAAGELVRASRPAIFVFPGQGSQYPGMAAALYEALPTFRDELDRCLDVLTGELPVDLRSLLLRASPQDAEAGDELTRTQVAQPALFAMEWALTRLLDSWGVRPAGMVGHSVGELVAATAAGVFELIDALRLVAERGRLIQRAEPGAMLAVALAADELTPWLDRTELAVINGPRSSVLSGTAAAVAEVAAELERGGQRCTRLRTSHAFHSRLVEPAAAPFAAAVRAVARRQPSAAWVSNVTGDWITAEQAVDPDYWATQLRRTVLFHDGIRTLTAEGSPVLLEVGPGQALTAQLRRDPRVRELGGNAVLALTPHQREAGSDVATLLGSAGQLWSLGVPIDRTAVDNEITAPRRAGTAARGVVALPSYPYQQRRYWIDPDPTPAPDYVQSFGSSLRSSTDRVLSSGSSLRSSTEPAVGLQDPWLDVGTDDRLTVPGWRQHPPASPRLDVADRRWLLLLDGSDPARALDIGLLAAGATMTAAVLPGVQARDGARTVDPDQLDLDTMRSLIGATIEGDDRPLEIVHCWAAGPRPPDTNDLAAAEHWHRLGFGPLLRAIQAVARDCANRPVRITAVTSGGWDVTGSEPVEPGKATLVGLLAVAAKESEALNTRVIDLPGERGRDVHVELLRELCAVDGPDQVALRPGRRWVRRYLPVAEPPVTGFRELVRPGGVYVITGGLGALGLVAARELAAVAPVQLALLGRRGLPERQRWDQLCAEPDTDPQLVQTLRAVCELESAGATVLPLTADVTDRASLAAALDKVRTQLGQVNGVVHSAGIAGGGLAAVKDPAVADAVLAPKTVGTLLLDELCGELDFMVLFSSIAAVTADFGLSDYAGANAFLDAFAHQRSRRGRTLSINWPSWAEAGMAVDNASAAPAMLRSMQLGGPTDPDIAEPLHPLLHRRLPSEDGVALFESDLDEGSWPLDEHRIDGLAMLPGTGYLELALAALDAAEPADGAMELSEVTFAAPLAVAGTRKVITRLTRAADAGWRFEVCTTDGSDPVVHASGRAARCAEPPAPAIDLDALRERCGQPAGPPDYDGGGGLLTVGPRWRNVVQTASGDGLRLVDLELAEDFAGDLRDYRLHPATLDGATAFSVDVDGHALPFAYQRVVVHGPLPGRFHSVLRVGSGDGRRLLVRDIALVDPDGRSLVEITGFAMRVVDAELARRSAAASLPTEPGQPAPALTADGAGPAAGLSTTEGARLFRALLGTDLGPQVVVAADGLSRRLVRSRAVTIGAVSEVLAHATGDTAPSTAGAEDGSATERTMIGLWRELLGGEVGRDDDFFDLGGDSLVAVQLIARVEAETGVQLPITTLFDTPTVAQLAAIVEERRAAT